MASNFCTACGNRLQPHQHFCPKCGAPVAHLPIGLAATPVYKPGVPLSAKPDHTRGIGVRLLVMLGVMIVVVMILSLFGNSLPSDVATFSLEQSNTVDTMAWSPDGTHFAAAINGYDSSDRVAVQVWEVASGKLVTTFGGHPTRIKALAWSGDGREIVSGSASQEQPDTPGTDVPALIQVWNATNGRTVVTYRGYSADEVDALSWAPDGHALVSDGLDWLAPSANSSNPPDFGESVLEWNMGTRSEGARYDTQNIYGNVTGLAWSPDGKYVAAADQGLVLWNAATGTLRWSSTTSEEQVAWSPDSRYLVSYGIDWAFNGSNISETQRIKIWDVTTGENISTLQTGGMNALNLVWLPNGKIAAVLKPKGGSTGTVSVWIVSATGQLSSSPCTNQFPFTSNRSFVEYAQLSPDGKRLAVAWARQGRNIDVWRVGCV